MKLEETSRGFKFFEFKDLYGEECSIQKSSLATEHAIWFGVSNPIPKILIQDVGWVPITLPSNTLLSGRMHLNQEQVKILLPFLLKFAKTGEL